MAKVVLYTAPKCPHSEDLKKFLSESGVSFEERDVLQDSDTMNEVFDKTQQMAIPVTLVDKDVYIGFDRRTQRRLKRSLGL